MSGVLARRRAFPLLTFGIRLSAKPWKGKHMSIFTRHVRSKKQELRTVSDASRDNTGGAQERKRRAAEHARYGDSAASSAASGGTKRKRPFKSVDFGGTASGTKAPRAGLHGGTSVNYASVNNTGVSNAGVSNTGVNNASVNNASVNYATNASGEAPSSATAESSLAEQLAALLGNALSGSGGYANANANTGVNANAGGVSVQAPDYDSLVELFEAYLRPTYDRAIENRHQAAQTSMADLDADAYSRGMGASTFVSSMREREQDDMNSDIAMLETEYASALSERLYEAMAAYSKLKLEADIYNAENALSASSTGRSTGRSSGRGSGKTASAGSGTGMSGKVKFGFDECKSLLGKFSTSERYDFFMSGDPYWKQMRSEMIEAIGRDRFEYLKDSYFGGAHGRHTNRDVIR